jgi:long-chain acyl-CoA synthetase
MTPSVVHMLADAAARAPDAEALVCGPDRLTYREFARCVAGFGRDLETQGVRGGRVALLMENSIDIVIAMFAAQAAGAQVVPLNPAYTPSELDPILRDAEPAVVLRGMQGLTRWRDAAACMLSDDLLPDADTLAALQYTGGTTGRAKGVDLTHRAASVNILQREAVLPTRDTDRILSVAPLYHVYAITMGLHLAVQARGTLVIMPRYDPAELLRLLRDERISVFAGNPRLFAELLSQPGLSDIGRSLRLCVSGSAPLPAEVLQRWEAATGVPICEGYGQTEAGPVLSYNSPHAERKPGSVGRALPDTELQIVDLETGVRVLPVGEAGEIRARGPQVMRGYRNRPEETAAALRDGWLYTGDIGELDTDGVLFIRGRRKEMVIVSGFNVYPREVEDVLHAHPDVHEAAVIGRPDARRGEALVAFVVARREAVDVAAVGVHLAERLTRYKLPSEIRVLDTLPRTAVGKIDKQRLQEMARQATDGVTAARNTPAAPSPSHRSGSDRSRTPSA